MVVVVVIDEDEIGSFSAGTARQLHMCVYRVMKREREREVAGGIAAY